MPRETPYQLALEGGSVRCTLCPKECVIAPGRVGICRTRRNEGGRLVVATHGEIMAAAVDPMEKKPLHHFMPGTTTFSIASAGCNLVCPFCQNHSLSQALRGGGSGRGARRLEAREVVRLALENGCRSVSFTYSEPILSIEFAAEVQGEAEGSDLPLVFVTNGQIREENLPDLAGLIAAANVDLKCFDAGLYDDVLGGSLDAALGTIAVLRERGVWVEVTTLVIPGFNDDEEQLAGIARFVAGVDPEIPWHVSRFHPHHRWDDRPPTSPGTIARAFEIGKEAGLAYVYAGNVPGHEGEKTRCAKCSALLVDRVGFRVGDVSTEAGRCPACNEPVAGVGFP